MRRKTWQLDQTGCMRECACYSPGVFATNGVQAPMEETATCVM